MAQPLACRSGANGVKWLWNCVAELRTRVVSAPRPSIAVALDDRAAVRARDFPSSPLRGGRKAQHQKYQPRMRTWSKGDLSGRGWLVFSQQGLSSLMFDYSRPNPPDLAQEPRWLTLPRRGGRRLREHGRVPC